MRGFKGSDMRVLDIPPFPRPIEILDLENFLRTRISETIVMWPNQAIPLLGAMCHPNDEAERDKLMGILRSWPDHSGPGRPAVPDKLGRIQANWLKVADIFHVYCDLIGGRHQEQRGGPSIGKAITLVSANAKNWGTGKSKLSELWTAYKDVAHLVTAATLICAEVRIRYRHRPPPPAGLNPTQFVPFQMALLMPDLVVAVAMEFERYGLGSDARPMPRFDPNTRWRIPADINVVPFPPLIRKLRSQDLIVLKDRRAGNRGRAKPKT
jgi:hypothetical protein